MSGSRSDTVGDAKLCVISRLPSSVQFALSTYTHTLQPRTRTVSLYANVPLCIHHDSYTFVIRYLRILHFLSTLPCFPSHFLLYNCSDKRKQRRMFHSSSDRSRSPWRHLASLVSFFFAYTWPGNGTLSYPLRSNTRPAIRSSPLPRDPIVIARLVITS